MTMRLSDPVKLWNLDEYIPSAGEDRVDLRYCGRDLYVDVWCNNEDGNGEFQVVGLHFIDVSYFIKGLVPGVSIFGSDTPIDASLLGHLIEYKWSELVRIGERESLRRGDRHFRFFLHSVGISVDAIAKDVHMLDLRQH